MVSFVKEKKGFLRYGTSFVPKVAGAESNLAIYVNRFGHTSGWISRLGEDEFGHLIQNAVRAEGVDVSQVKFVEGGHSGVMFRQMLPGRETSVFYYRDNSAAVGMQPEDVSEDYLKGAKILHLTGITPILSESCLATVKKAVNIAKSCGCMISFDPNIRKKLWNGKDYKGLLRDLIMEADIVLLGREEADILFDSQNPEQIIKHLFLKGNAKYAAVKDGSRGAVVAVPGKIAAISPYACCCEDPIGAGDAFDAGFLSGILEERPIKWCGKMGAAAGALATESVGDTEGCPSRWQLELFLQGREEVTR